ncbi:MAG TPA: response regulator [Candidatus Nitrosotenuis sp.]|nr:response regulator [Candidatus Nitrosotenuis sp.]
MASSGIIKNAGVKSQKEIILVKVIVVDDDVDTVEVFCEYLEIKDITVLGRGYNGKTAVELYEQHRPDIVLLDVMMPEYDGFYGLEHIKKINPNAKIIMVTADLTYDTEKQLKTLNASAVIYKPYEIDSVIDTIQRVYDGAVLIQP